MNKRRLKNDLNLIQRSGLFDSQWYYATYPDVAYSGELAEVHYLTVGGFEGYDPCDIFSSSGYYKSYPDVKESGLNPLLHYSKYGKKEGRSFIPSVLTTGYPEEITTSKVNYYKFFETLPNLSKPEKFTEKILAYKLFYTDKDLSRFVDKYKVREFVSDRIGKQFLIPLLGLFKDPDEIDIQKLPDQFVIKATHGSGWNILCSDKRILDWNEQKKILHEWLNTNFYDRFFEWAYMNVPPRIIIEEFIHDNKGAIPKDYKFFCFNGEPVYIQVDSDRFTEHKRDFYDLQWKHLPLQIKYPSNRETEAKPENLPLMLEISKKLSNEFPFVRVDLYSVPDVFFGELSFYPEAGYTRFAPPIWDDHFGKLFTLPVNWNLSSKNAQTNLYKDLELIHLRSKRYRFDFSCFLQSRKEFEFLANEDMIGNLIKQMTKGVNTFIDIGAGCGFYSILAGKSNPELEIHCFEPVPMLHDLLTSNLADNHIQAVVHHFLASDVDGDTEIQTTDRIGEFRINTPTNQIDPHRFIVKTVRGDRLLQDISAGPVLLRIEARGYEIRALEGLKELIEKTTDLRLIIRYEHERQPEDQLKPSEFVAQLDKLGFDVYVVDEDKREYRRIEKSISELDAKEHGRLNLVCIKKEKSANILFFSHSPHLFGAERSLLDLTGSLTTRYGAMCTVVVPGEGPLNQALQNSGVAVKVIPYTWWCAQPDFMPSQFEVDRGLAASYKEIQDHLQDIERIDPDVIVTSTMVIPWGAITAMSLNRPHIWWVKEYGDLDHGLVFHFPLDEILKVIGTASNYVVVPSNALLTTHFNEISGTKGIVAYNIKPVFTETGQVLSSCYADPAALKLLIFGVVRESKGHEEAVKAIELLLSKGRNVELCILGHASNPFGEALKAQVESLNLVHKIHFLGFNSDVRQIIEQSDLGLMCSRNEAFGRTTVEAMMLGKPVIGTKSGGTTELIKDGVDGLLYSAGDVDQLVDRIEFFIDEPEKLREFGARARENILKKLGEKPVDDIMLDLFFKLRSENYPGSKELNDLGHKWLKYIPGALVGRITELESTVTELESKITDLETKISGIESSRKWKFAMFLGRVRAMIAPDESRRLRFFRRFFGAIKNKFL